MTDNAAWLAGYAAYERDEPCPWEDSSARDGWLAALAAKARLIEDESADNPVGQGEQA